MINKEQLKEVMFEAEKGDIESIAIVREVLRPLKSETVDEILEKIRIFSRLIFLDSMKYKDAYCHEQIDRAYAEQIHSILNRGRPKYTGIIIIGYRESAKTTRVKFNETYMSLYIGDIMDSINVVSENGKSSSQFNMDMFNVLAFSKVAKYFPNTIAQNLTKKKESQTMAKFTTTTGVTYSATSARQSNRGNVKMDIDDNSEVNTKRPKKVIFDDIENETTILSFVHSDHILSVANASIDGLDQILGFWMLLGNYISLRRNIAKFLNKYRDDPNVLIITIPILDGAGNVTWPDKYCRTDAEEIEWFEKGITKKSIETIQRDSDNFQIEYMNNPKRSLVYFDDVCLSGFNEEGLVKESRRDDKGYLELEEPNSEDVYVISVDVATGLGKDESSFTVTKISGIRYEEVANFKSKVMRPENLASYSSNIGRRYNNALIIPENNYPGNEFIAFLLPIYHNIYIDSLDKDGKPVYGINTNMKTKPEMFLNAKKVFKNKLYTVRSQALYNQIAEYPDSDIHEVKQRDGSGGHFDLLMSAVIGIWKAVTKVLEKQNDGAIDKLIKKTVDSVFREEGNHL
jgi:hypothetical protein